MKNKLAWGLVILLMAAAVTAQEMPHSVAEAQKLESKDALPATPLYSNPTLGTSRPGDLLAQEPVTSYVLPAMRRAPTSRQPPPFSSPPGRHRPAAGQ